MRSISSSVRYSWLWLASFGWRTSGFLLRFAENDVWRKSITAAIIFVPYRFERSHFAMIGHCRQSDRSELNRWFLLTGISSSAYDPDQSLSISQIAWCAPFFH